MLKLPYLNRWLKKLRGKTKPAMPEHMLSRIAWQVRTAEELRNLPDDFFLLVFGKNGVENILEGDFPRTLSPEFFYWIVPKNEVTLTVPFFAWESSCRVETIVELEPEVSLEWLVKSREVLEEPELIELIAEELIAILDSLNWSPESFDDEFKCEQLRAKLSLRLMEKGFRCTGLVSFSKCPLPGHVDVSEEIITTDMVEDREEEPDFVQEEKVVEEIQSYIEQKPQDWDELYREFIDSDLEITPDEAQEWENIREDHRQNRFSLEQTTRKIMLMAGEKAATVDAPAPDLARWSNAATRRRVADMQESDFDVNAPVCGSAVRPEDIPFGQEEPIATFDKTRTDNQLRQMLELSLKTSRNLYAQRRQSLELVIHLTEIRRLDRELQMLEDMLQTLPALKPAEESLRYRNDEICIMLEALEQGKRIADQVEIQARQLLDVTAGSQEWKKVVNESRQIICRLSQTVNARRRVSV